jgi:single-strand selective monofunctional uracil DNA glycosylase
MRLALTTPAKHIAAFAIRAATWVPSSAKPDALDNLLARHPGSSRFTQFLRATLLLRSELALWQGALPLPLPNALRRRKDPAQQPRSETLGYIYNPWVYASGTVARYLDTYGPRGQLTCLLLGLNPGPWGMTQTGVPFADPHTARIHLGLTVQATAPGGTHPRVQVTGAASTRQEGSARAVSALMSQRYGSVAGYYTQGFVMNFCPLLLLDEGGENVTPADLRIRHPLLRQLRNLCDAYLACVVQLYQPNWVITLGGYTEERLTHVLRRTGLRGAIETGGLLHPSDLARHLWSGTHPSWEAYADASLTLMGAP